MRDWVTSSILLLILVVQIQVYLIESNAVAKKKKKFSKGAEMREVCEVNSRGEEICTFIPKDANEQGLPRKVSFNECQDRHARCVNDATNGECEKNPVC